MKKNISLIKDIVLKMGGTIDEFLPERGCYYINVLGVKILLEGKISINRNSFVSAQLTRCKDITHKLLADHGLSTPKTEYFYNKNYNKTLAKKTLSTLNYPIIIKDSCGSNSVGVFTMIKNTNEALKILEKKLPLYKSMIAQEMVFGKEYRVLVLNNKIIGALQIMIPHINGDGVSSVKKLIQEKQKNTRWPTKINKKILKILADQDVTIESILPKKKIIYFKKNSCWAEGWETKDVTDVANKEIEKICVQASKLVGKHLVGIDIICKDISDYPTKKSFSILEINGKPDLYIHYNPTYGETRDVIRDIVKFMARLAKPIS